MDNLLADLAVCGFVAFLLAALETFERIASLGGLPIGLLRHRLSSLAFVLPAIGNFLVAPCFYLLIRVSTRSVPVELEWLKAAASGVAFAGAIRSNVGYRPSKGRENPSDAENSAMATDILLPIGKYYYTFYALCFATMERLIAHEQYDFVDLAIRKVPGDKIIDRIDTICESETKGAQKIRAAVKPATLAKVLKDKQFYSGLSKKKAILLLLNIGERAYLEDKVVEADAEDEG